MNLSVKLLLLILLSFTISNVVKYSPQLFSNQYQALDFRTYYLGAASFQKYKNPYKDSNSIKCWEEMKLEHKSIWNKKIGFPNATVVYAPSFLFYWIPFTLFDFDNALKFQLYFNLLAIVLSSILIFKLNNELKFPVILSSILAFRGTWYALLNGQPIFHLLLFILFAFYLIEKKNFHVVAGIILGSICFKFTLLFPIIFYLFLLKKWKTFVPLLLTAGLLNILFIGQNPSMVIDWQNNMNLLWHYIHNGQIHHLNKITTGIFPFIQIALKIPLIALKAISLTLLFITFGIAYLKQKNAEGRYSILLSLTLMSFAMGQHLIYDLIWPLALFLMTYNNETKIKKMYWVLYTLMLIPMGRISDIIHLKAFEFALPITIFIVSIHLFQKEFFNKNKTTKNAN